MPLLQYFKAVSLVLHDICTSVLKSLLKFKSFTSVLKFTKVRIIQFKSS